MFFVTLFSFFFFLFLLLLLLHCFLFFFSFFFSCSFYVTRLLSNKMWKNNSRCTVVEAATPDGPYTRVGVVMDSFCHGTSMMRDPASGMWVWNHMGTSSVSQVCGVCTNGTTPFDEPHAPCPREAPSGADSTSALVSAHPLGPWTPAPQIMNGANCEPFFTPNGTFFMACPWGGRTALERCNRHNAALSLHRADSLAAGMACQWHSYNMTYWLAGAAGTPGDQLCFNWEDQNLWVDRRGNFHSLMHAFRGQPTDYPLPGCHQDPASGQWLPANCTSNGGHAFSPDGTNWYVSPVQPFNATVIFDDGRVVPFRARERPHLIFTDDGDLAYLLNGVGNPGPGQNVGVRGQDHTWTLIQPLRQRQK